jgi:hypothetical protein
MVSAVVGVAAVAPLVSFLTPVWKMMSPSVAVPVESEPMTVAFWPAMFEPKRKRRPKHHLRLRRSEASFELNMNKPKSC